MKTRPTTEQIRFRSTKTGEHILDAYMEAVERGDRTLADMLDDAFDPSTGLFRTDLFEFRFHPTSAALEFRVGDFPDATTGWRDVPFTVNPQVQAQAAEDARIAAEAARDLTLTYRDTTNQHRIDSQAAQSASELARNQSQTARTDSQSARDLAQSYRDTALSHRNAADTARIQSEAARDSSQAYRDTAQGHANTANQHRIDSQAARDLSQAYRDESLGHANTSSAHRLNAQNAQTASETARNLSQAWAEGTEPGGAGTKSAKEHAEEVAATRDLLTPVNAEILWDLNRPTPAGWTDFGERLAVGASTKAIIQFWTVNGNLFANDEAGVWLDPSDASTLFQDATGTTPAGIGDPVRLALDKSKGLELGLELFSDFSTVTSPWAALGGGEWSIDGSQVSNRDLSISPFYTAGKLYATTFTLSGLSGGTISLFPGDGSGVSSLGNGTHTVRLRATQAYLIFRAPAGVAATVTNISVRELPGNHALAPSDAARPVVGRVPFGGRRNLLTYTEEFDNAAWTKQGASVPTVSANTSLAPDGTMTADELIFGASTDSRVQQTVTPTTDGAIYTISVWLRTLSGTRTVRIGTSNINSDKYIDVTAGTNWTRFSKTFAAGSSEFPMIINQTGTSGTVLVWGAQLETGSTVTPYQRVGSQFDVTEAGIPSAIYLRRDLIDDRLDVTLPAITNGKIIIGTTEGVWVDDLTFAGGTFSLGPTTYTGGPAGLYDAIGADELGTIILDRQPTASELANIMKWFKSKGAPGRFVLGSELVVNGTFDTDTSGWTAGSGMTLSAIDGDMRIERGGSVNQNNYTEFSTEIDAPYLLAWEYKGRSAASNHYTDFRSSATISGGGYYREIDIGSEFSQITRRGAFKATGTTGYVTILLRDGVSGDWIEVDNISVRPLTVEPF